MLVLNPSAENLTDQDAPHVHVDWKPPAGGNERLMNILEKNETIDLDHL